jgi:hypothetical protein
MPSNLAMPMLDEWNGQPSGTEDGSQGHKVLILRFRVLVLSLLIVWPLPPAAEGTPGDVLEVAG